MVIKTFPHECLGLEHLFGGSRNFFSYKSRWKTKFCGLKGRECKMLSSGLSIWERSKKCWKCCILGSCGDFHVRQLYGSCYYNMKKSFKFVQEGARAVGNDTGESWERLWASLHDIMCDDGLKLLIFAVLLDFRSNCFMRHFWSKFRLWVTECGQRRCPDGHKNFSARVFGAWTPVWRK